MNTFFKQLAETLKDRQELRFTAKKIEGELVLIVAPDFQKEGTNIHMTGTPEELDESFFLELKKPLEAKVEFQSNAEEVANELKEEVNPVQKSEQKDTASGKKAATNKASKRGIRKEEGKVVTAKKPITEPVIEAGEEHAEKLDDVIENLENKSTEEIEAAIVSEVNADEDILNKSDLSFNESMDLGKILFADRKYKEAEQAYQMAVDLQPDNKKAIEARDNATKWVKAVANLGI